MTWPIALLAFGCFLAGTFLGIAMGYNRGRLDGRHELGLELVRRYGDE